ncbi:MAG: hypothetical protein C1943_09920 [Halochromatium sp.]|nr:hypothetical protein [Halochromatium sp.]
MRPLLPIAVLLFSGLLAACAGGVQQRPDPNITAAQRMLSLDQTLETPSFEANGGTIVDATIDGYKTAIYVIGVVKGQVLTVQVESDTPNVYFDVLEPTLGGGSAKIFSTEAACRGTRIHAPSDTTYVIRPFLAKSLAERNASVRYTLCINRCEAGMTPANCQWMRGNLQGI